MPETKPFTLDTRPFRADTYVILGAVRIESRHYMNGDISLFLETVVPGAPVPFFVNLEPWLKKMKCEFVTLSTLGSIIQVCQDEQEKMFTDEDLRNDVEKQALHLANEINRKQKEDDIAQAQAVAMNSLLGNDGGAELKNRGIVMPDASETKLFGFELRSKDTPRRKH